MTELDSRFIMMRRYLLVASEKREMLRRSGVHDTATVLQGGGAAELCHHK